MIHMQDVQMSQILKVKKKDQEESPSETEFVNIFNSVSSKLVLELK